MKWEHRLLYDASQNTSSFVECILSFFKEYERLLLKMSEARDRTYVMLAIQAW
jgi:hypothetical protein